MQINRFFEIIYLLLEKKTITATELAAYFEVSTRTIYRDIEALSMSGIPIYMQRGKGGGVSLLDDFVLNKAVLTSEEKSDVLSSLHAVDAISFHQTNTVLQKLGSLFGKESAEWIEIDFSSWYNAEKESDLFNHIKSAILSKKMIRFSYSSQKGKNTVREVEPLRLCFKGMSRYLYAYCLLRQDFRFFKLNRMHHLELTEQTFTRTINGPIFHEMPAFQEEFITLTLKLSSEIAFRVYDEFESYTKKEDGSFIANITYPLGEWLFPYLASFGVHCEILEPTEIRESFQAHLREILNNYL